MSLIDDPRLTSYALGELTDVAQRAALEAELANDPLAQAEVDAIRAAAVLLRTQLKDELGTLTSAAGGTDRSERTLEYATATPHASAVFRRGRYWATAAAAAVVVGGLATAALVTSRAGSRPQPVSIRIAARPSAVPHSQPSSDTMATDPWAKIFPNAESTSPAASTAHASANLASGEIRASIVATPRPELVPGGRPDPGNIDRFAAAQAAPPVVSTPALASQSGEPAIMNNVPLHTQPSLRPAEPQAAGNIVALGAQNFSRSAAAESFGNVPSGVDPAGEFASDARVRLERATTGLQATSERVEHARAALSSAMASIAPEPVHGRRDRELERLSDQVKAAHGSAESYAPIQDNAFLDPTIAPLSTFGVDVDSASFANVRRFLVSNQLPPRDAVRIEELINYFPTNDAPPTNDKPFAVHTEVGECPWAAGHALVRVALKGKVIENEKRPPSNLVFLIDVSGSMNEPNKLPLVQRSLRKLVGQLGEGDRVAIVVYAGSSGLVLPSTSATEKAQILGAIDNLKAGGSTNGGEGIELAYKTAADAFIKNGTNRVILCTDGDFNVGITDRTALFDLIAAKARQGTFLSVCGFGTGNTKDDTMEGLADKGNGQYAYIDGDREADKVFVSQIGGTLVTIAKDVKLQLEFNPATVKSYRLIGYENRVLAAEDFNNDLKDAGDIGAGHSVVALYEVDRAGGGADRPGNPERSELKYQKRSLHEVAADANTKDLLTLKLRFKKPDAPLEQGVSELIETTVEDRPTRLGETSNDFRFAASVAAFGMMLRESPYKGSCSWDLVRSLATDGVGADPGGYRSEFLNLIDQASRLRR